MSENNADIGSGATEKPDAEAIEKITAIQSKLHETFGRISLAMMALPRYRHQNIADLNHILLEPLIRDRVAIAMPKPNVDGEAQLQTLSGVAIWASVSEEVDLKIREQIAVGVFPIRLKADDWVSGEINWLLDVLTPTPKMVAGVIANFKQVIKSDEVRIHPMVRQMIGEDMLKNMDGKALDVNEVGDA